MPGWGFGGRFLCRPYLVATVVSWNLQFLQRAATPMGSTVGSSLSTSPPKRVNSCGMKPLKFIHCACELGEPKRELEILSSATPDFLSMLVALVNIMRLSLEKVHTRSVQCCVAGNLGSLRSG